MSRATTTAKAGSAVGVLAIAGAIAFPHLAKWEGLRTEPYADKLAYGVMTVCYGSTTAPMRRYTPAECRQMAVEALQRDYGPIVLKCTPGIAGQRPEVLASALLLSYNIGGAAYCGSTVARRFNAGRWREGCDAYLLWNRAGGVAVRGLTNRRRDERALCLSGVG